jgi:hypothetical protein
VNFILILENLTFSKVFLIIWLISLISFFFLESATYGASQLNSKHSYGFFTNRSNLNLNVLSCYLKNKKKFKYLNQIIKYSFFER